jgi:membrane associated rhomboid family serine protease
MNDETEAWAVLLTADQRRCAELALVLEARGIPSRQTGVGNRWVLSVLPHDVAVAAEELVVYERENLQGRARPPVIDVIGIGWPGVVAYAAALLVVAICVQQGALGFDWLYVGRMDAGLLRSGQWWRAVTALTIHLELDHLLGNLAFGAFFTYFVGRYLGGGLGWLAILMAGTLGNVMSGLVEAADHRAIGASTAVFGALGILTAHTWRRGFPAGTSWRGRVAPLIAGLGLLAFTGTGGENTDIGAHLTGFVAGFGIGLLAARYRLAAAHRLQLPAAVVAGLIVCAAWAWGLAAIG